MSEIYRSGSLIVEAGDESATARRIKEKGNGAAVLAAAIQGGERDGASVVDNVVGLVAEKVFATDVRNGEKLILPLAGVILRVARRGLSAGRDCSRPVGASENPSSLTNLAETLCWMELNQVDGCIQGDCALHYAGGFDGRHLRNAMKGDEAAGYCKYMARVGYGRAIAQMSSKDPRAEQLATLVARFPDAAAILSSCLDVRAA